MASTLHPLLPPTRSGRTFSVASSLLGLAALAQLIMMGVFLARSGGVPRRQAAPAVSFAETLPPTAPANETPALQAAVVPTPAPPGALADVPPPGIPSDVSRPTPAPSSPNGTNTLIDQARQLRQRGDMPSALARLREAQVAQPDSPQIIAEMALTYEAMQLPDRAFEQWQRIYNLGESVGALYYLADSRLHAPPTPASGLAAGAGNGPSAFQENSVLKITDIHADRVPDPAAEKVVLKIVVKNRPGTGIDPTKVRILTYFYDLLDGKEVVLTDAQTDYAWVTPAPIDWVGDKSEVLETTYLRPKDAPATPAASAAPTPTPAHASRRGSHGRKAEAETVDTPAPAATPAPVRTYLGYIVRLYYDRQLQDDKTDPIMLLQRFPSPSTLPAD